MLQGTYTGLQKLLLNKLFINILNFGKIYIHNYKLAFSMISPTLRYCKYLKSFFIQDRDPFILHSQYLADSMWTQGARASTAMVLTLFFQNKLVPAPGWLPQQGWFRLGLLIDDERQPYFVVMSLIGWAQAKNQPCSSIIINICCPINAVMH